MATARNTLAGIIRAQADRIDTVRRTLQAVIQAEWRAEARTNLGASRAHVAEYVRNINRVGTNAVELTGTFPNMLERGMGPAGVGSEGAFDLKNTLLQPTTRSIRKGKNGLYLNVPFGRTVAMIKALGGTAAYKAARALSATVSTAAGTRWGDRLPPGMAPKLATHHATDPLASLYRFRGNYSTASGVKGRSTYRNFRTISQGGRSWIHPGIRARKIAERVLAKMDTLVSRALGGGA